MTFHRNKLAPRSERSQYYRSYTLIFGVLCLVIFSWFYLSGRTLIWDTDGWSQHYKALAYYGQYLRQILRTLLVEHRLNIPEWGFTISEGAGIITTLHYYVVGDPLALLSVFFPTDYTYILYSFLMILRLYLAGIAYSELCFGLGRKEPYAVCAGAIAYVFCLWGLQSAAMHPYFLNPMIYFPLIILGVEQVIARKKSRLLSIIVAVSAASNFYFFYIIVLMTVLYVAVRLLTLYGKDGKAMVRDVLRIAAASITGVLMSGILLLPILVTFLGDSRLGVQRPWPLFYPISHYSQLPSLFLSASSSYWLLLGFAVPVIPAIFLLFFRKGEHKLLKRLFWVCLAITLCPIPGRILNGFGYISNRWCWAFSLLCCFILTTLWEDLISLSRKEVNYLFAAGTVYYLLCLFLEESRSIQAFSNIALYFIILMAIQALNEKYSRSVARRVLCLLVCFSVALTGFWKYSPAGGNFASEAVEAKTARETLTRNETTAIQTLADEEVVRYSGRNTTDNAGLLSGMSSTFFFWSLSNPYVNEFRSDLSMLEYCYSIYAGYDDRASLLSLASVNYYVVPSWDTQRLPYGFEYVGNYNVQEERTNAYIAELMEELQTDTLSDAQFGKVMAPSDSYYTVYKNKFALPIGYCYDRCLTDAVWEELTPLERQSAMLKAAYLSEPAQGLAEYVPQEREQSMDYAVSFNSDEITWQGDQIITTAANASITLTFEGLPNSETYISYKGLDFDSTPAYELYFGDESVDPLNLYNRTNWKQLSASSRSSIRKTNFFYTDKTIVNIAMKASSDYTSYLTYTTPNFSFASGRQDFVCNLGYSEEPLTSVTITFPTAAIYTIDALDVICVPYDTYEEDIARLSEHVLENVEYDVDTLRGSIRVDSPQVLCVTIPYSEGWQAYVDGVEATVHVANGRYLGIEIPAGEHQITLTYSTPYLRLGAMVSVLGLAILGGSVLADRCRTKKRRKSKTS